MCLFFCKQSVGTDNPIIKSNYIITDKVSEKRLTVFGYTESLGSANVRENYEKLCYTLDICCNWKWNIVQFSKFTANFSGVIKLKPDIRSRNAESVG